MTRVVIGLVIAVGVVGLTLHPLNRADEGRVEIVPAATTLRPGGTQVVCSIVRFRDGSAKLGQDAYRFTAHADSRLTSVLVRDVREACAPVLAPLGLDALTMEMVDTSMRRTPKPRGVLT